jgi:hypothetical protein
VEALNSLFLFTLGTTIVLRGLGAGIITGVELITLPARRRMDVIRYAQFARAYYKSRGVFVYAVITVLGALVT